MICERSKHRAALLRTLRCLLATHTFSGERKVSLAVLFVSGEAKAELNSQAVPSLCAQGTMSVLPRKIVTCGEIGCKHAS